MSSDKSYVEQVAIATASECLIVLNFGLKTLRLGSALHEVFAHCEIGPDEYRCLLGCRRRVWLMTPPLMCKTRLQR